jgi:outer membrane protein insertion porin family
MAGVRRSRAVGVSAAIIAVLLTLRADVCRGQGPLTVDPDGGARHRYGTSAVTKPDASMEREKIVDVRVVGNQHVKLDKITHEIHTRAGRPFDPQMIEEDVRRLTKTRLFVSVDTTYQRAPTGGVIVVFRLLERPTLRYVKYVGNTVRKRTVEKQTGLKSGDSLDPYMVTEARRKLEEWYVSKGYSKARVTIIEGDKLGDAGVVFLINEGQKQRIYSVQFVGNTIADDARLRTQVKSKKPLLYLFKGELDRGKIDEDVDRLTTYYRSLGFFRAQIGRELEFNEKQNWITLTFVINEGQRFKVRDVALIGNKKVTSEKLLKDLQLTSGKFFDQATMDKDVTFLQNKYGSQGFIFAAVEADPRFLEEPGQLDLIYQVQEGDRYRVGLVNVKINGDSPRTRRHTILNRISVFPGDIADTRELRDSQRRMRAAGIFMNKPQDGIEPKITFRSPDLDGSDTETADSTNAPRRRKMRGQSPDGAGPAQQSPPGAGHVTIRGQSPDPAYSAPRATPGFGDPTSAGQVPLGQTGPGTMPTRTDAWRNPGGNVVPVQYTQPVPGAQPYAPYSQAPAAGQPGAPGAYPPGAYPPAAQPYAPSQPYAPATPYSQAPPPAQAGAPGAYPPAAQPYVPSQPYAPATPYGQAPPAGQSAAPGSYPPATGYAAPNAYPGSAPGQLPPGQGQPFMPGVAPITPGGPGTPPGQLPPPAGYDSGNQLFPPDSIPADPNDVIRQADVDVGVQEAQTGRFMIGVGVNSSAGLIGNITLDEQNFDWRRFPTSFEDIRNGTALRGGGQQLRITAMPGTQLSQYSATFREPYLMDSKVSFSLSGQYFMRYYQDWTEVRAGGRTGLGYQFTPDLSGTFALRGEAVNVKNPTVPTPPELAEALGIHPLFTARWDLIHDTRDSTFLPTEGHYVDLSFEQGFGHFDFPRAIVDARQHFLIHERPDRSGRQVLNLISTVGFTGSNTPIFEHFFAGGYQTLRGFYFRGASPLDENVQVGGTFEWLNSVEYMFPLMPDDMLRGVTFVDFGTVAPTTELKWDDYRIAPGVGLRISIPAMGPAPIALDFACPVHHAPGDHIQNISFFVGYAR